MIDAAGGGFQSTRPVWGATGIFRVNCCQILISIHAPRVGRDVRLRQVRGKARQFQSTRPVWGATSSRYFVFVLLSISIHAPRVGRD